MTRRILGFAAVSLFMFAAAAGAQYVVTGSEGAFSVTRNTFAVVTGVPVDAALAAIREHAMGDPVTVQLGNGTAVLDLGANSLNFHNLATDSTLPPWGKVTLTGSAASTAGARGAVSIRDVEMESRADVAETSTGNGFAFRVEGSAPLEITGGTISSVYSAVYALSASGAITITGGTITTTGGSARDAAIYASASAARVTTVITGGTVSAAVGIAIYGGNVEISGGKLEAAANYAVYNAVNVSVSGTAVVASASAEKATINSEGGTGEIKITGGEVSNTADGGRAVYLSGASRTLTLGGAPKIIGSIAARFAGVIRAEAFAPAADAEYTLELFGNARADGAVALAGGAAHIGKFHFYGEPYSLTARGGDIVVTLPANFTAPLYVITGDTVAGFTAKKGAASVGTSTALQHVIDSIQANADVMPCSISFGSGNQVLRMGRYASPLLFDGNRGNGWGRVTLLGRLHSAVYGNQGNPNPSAISFQNGVSVESSADVEHADVRSFKVLSGSDLTIKGGTIVGAIDVDDGTLTMAGGTVSWDGDGDGWRAVENSATGTVHISGGTVTSTNAATSAILNHGELTISGTAAIVSADASVMGGTIVNRGSGSVSITGGTVENTGSGQALHNDGDSAAAVTISGGEITSKNAKNLGGTLKSTRGKVEISGGKISNAERIANGNAVINSALMYISGAAEITSVSGNASTIYNLQGGAMEVSGGKISNLWDSIATARAIINEGTLTISGTAEITAKSAAGILRNNNMGTVQNSANPGFVSVLHLIGGTIKSTADSNGVAVALPMDADSRRGGAAFIGGSPTLTGVIAAGFGGITATIITAGENLFNPPGDKVYSLRNTVPDNRGGGGGQEMEWVDGTVLFANGARFTSNFELVTDISENKDFKPAAKGNDIVAAGASTQTYNVTFNLNGGTGTLPGVIRAVAGAKLGALAKPPTADLASPDRFKSDGKWYISNGSTGGVHTVGNEFIFDLSGDGTPINSAFTLVPDWTDEVSVASNDRVIPQNPGSETAVVAPVTITAGEFTAGPNPAKRSGHVNFFWSGKSLANGSLSVYDASGNLVKKISVSDRSALKSGKRSVGSWDLTDAKGRPMPEGVYLVKGAVAAKDGAKVKVSAIVGVAR